MKNIKFRAWDGENMHYMVTPFTWDFVLSLTMHKCTENTGTGMLGTGGKTAKFELEGNRYKKIMQYTTLNEKVGDKKDIYTGDIVSGEFETLNGAKNICGIVTLNEGCFGFEDLIDGDTYTLNRISNREVIGNIYDSAICLRSYLNIDAYKDGDKWCVLIGENLQEGYSGFGETPTLAFNDLAQNIYKQDSANTL